MTEQEENLPPLPPFEPGVYRHWKTGDLYLALSVSGNSEARGSFVVNYYSYKYRCWRHRDYGMWHEGIHDRQTQDGTVYSVPRFWLVAPVLLDIPDICEGRAGSVFTVPGFFARATATDRSISPMPANPNATIKGST